MKNRRLIYIGIVLLICLLEAAFVPQTEYEKRL